MLYIPELSETGVLMETFTQLQHGCLVPQITVAYPVLQDYAKLRNMRSCSIHNVKTCINVLKGCVYCNFQVCIPGLIDVLRHAHCVKHVVKTVFYIQKG